jgi:hypothetical protein
MIENQPGLSVPAGFLPTPSAEYAESVRAAGPAPLPRKLPIPRPPRRPIPLDFGSRVLIYKQDPSVSEIGIRKLFLPHRPSSGPRDARIRTQGLPVVNSNSLGDFVIVPDPTNDTVMEAFDAVHTFAIVRTTLTMVQRALGGAALPWQWNTGGNVDAVDVFPHAGVTMNAFYSRTSKCLKFFFFTPPGTPTPPLTYTCRSLDIVSHETGHAILDGLKPDWLLSGNPPQTGGLHESFGDLMAIFATLSQLDQVEAIIAQTKANLHDTTFLAALAEQFGNALGRSTGLRNADNNLKLSEVGTEVHAISQVFTGGMYDVLADWFQLSRDTALRDDAVVLHDTAQYLLSVLLRAIQGAPASAATFADVVNQMRGIVVSDGKPAAFRASITNNFALREVVAAGSLDLTGAKADDKGDLQPLVVDAREAVQDRTRCCGTMQRTEYTDQQSMIDQEVDAFRAQLEEAQNTGTKAKTKR